MKKHYAVFGSPIAHSLSPIIHKIFADEFELELEYDKVHVAPKEFESKVREFFGQGGNGLNITLPHKSQAFQLARSCGPEAARSRTANTMSLKDGVLHADNTDGIGLVRDLRDNLCCDIAGKEILIMGAGGAVSGILPNLINAQPASIDIVNRSEKRINELHKLYFRHLSDKHVRSQFHIWKSHLWRSKNYDFVINAVSVAPVKRYALNIPKSRRQVSHLEIIYPDDLIGPHTIVYDLNYSLEPTDFVNWGVRNEAFLVQDGLGMLVEQAAESFYHWHKVRPQTKGLVQRLRNQLGGGS